ncbi:hypothetical protein EYF80_042164 [Liparis tanakae]|uniref:Uncharacterized protein n=1 Tax=Liparis tanakae TaxID=230148 RepID=A0A4Z2G4D5_9TELE|nr:hypothetical protein EYF80_042164 [Liparis tanakae]
MATTLVISPTTNTMLKTVLYNGYLNPSFLSQVELFAELFSAQRWVKLKGGRVLLYILRDKEWLEQESTSQHAFTSPETKAWCLLWSRVESQDLSDPGPDRVELVATGAL